MSSQNVQLNGLYTLPTFDAAPQSGFQIQLDGVALPTVLNQLVATIKEQALQLQELQSYTYSDLTSRMANVEARVARLEADVAIEQRPRHGGLPNLSSHMDSVDFRVKQLESFKKLGQATKLEEITNLSLLRRWYKPWLLRSQLHLTMASLQGKTSVKVHRKFFQKWTRYLSVVNRQRQMQRKCRGLLYATSKGVQHKFFDRWSGYHNLLLSNREKRLHTLESAAATIATISTRAVARKAFQKWQLYVQASEETQQKIGMSERMESISARALVNRYFMKWASIEASNEGARRQRTIIYAMSMRAFDNLGKQKLQLWRAFALRKKARRQGINLMPHYSVVAMKKLAGRYLAKLGNYAKNKQHIRDRIEIDAMWTELRRRCDGLATQVDVGLKAQTNTNGVLAQLVERVLLIERQNDQQEADGAMMQ